MRFQLITLVLFLLLGSDSFGQRKFRVMTETVPSGEIYSLVDEYGNLIRKLDTSRYYISLNNDQPGYFAVVGMKGVKGWAAIDADENLLFNVYNTSIGEPSPDILIEGKIRIVGTNNLIGFADHKGRVIIEPQFEAATSFHDGRAIIGRACKLIPWDEHANENDCKHYSIICEQHGYIDTKGTVLKMGSFSYEEIMKEIDWKMPDDQN